MIKPLLVIICIIVMVCNGCITSSIQITNQQSVPTKKIAILQPAFNISRILGGYIGNKEVDSIQKKYPMIPFDSLGEYFVLEQKIYYSTQLQQLGAVYFDSIADELAINLQPIDTTNVILAGHGIEYRHLEAADKGKLCKLLGVDAVLYVRFTGTSGQGSFNRYSMSHNSGTHTEYSYAALYSATDTLWQCQGRGFGFFSAWHNSRLLMRKTIKKLPYRKP